MGEWRYSATTLTVALDGGEWSALCLCCFTLDTHCIGSWVRPRVSLDVSEKRKILSMPRIKPRLLGHPAHTVATELSQFVNPEVCQWKSVTTHSTKSKVKTFYFFNLKEIILSSLLEARLGNQACQTLQRHNIFEPAYSSFHTNDVHMLLCCELFTNIDLSRVMLALKASNSSHMIMSFNLIQGFVSFDIE
jgi:hypothetical protein